MGKKYKITASSHALSGTGNDLTPVSNGMLRAGKISSTNYGTYCTFAGLADIDQSKVTAIKLHLQRVAGDSDITYSVQLYYSVLSSSPGSGSSLRVRTGYAMFTTNRVSWNWEGNASDVGGEYRTITIPVSLFNQLKSYGWCISQRDQTRCIRIGDVYLEIETTEPEASPVRMKTASGLKTGNAYVKTASGIKPVLVYRKTASGLELAT